MKVKVTKKGLLIPKEVADRAFDSSDEVEVFEEPGRLLIVADKDSPGDTEVELDQDPILKLGRNPVGTVVRDGQEDPIFSMGEDPVDDVITDASENHDRYLYRDG